MITSVKDRTLEVGQEVYVYRNLNAKGNVFSIKDKKTGLVIAHADKFIIEFVKTKISESGRQRVIKSKNKNVHAQLLGLYVRECEMDVSQMDELYYNPYTLNHFINKRTNEQVDEINLVYFQDGKAYIHRND